jgi:hypothetical protein
MASISGVDTTDINGINGFFTTQGGGTATTDPTITLGFATVYFNQTVTVTNHNSYTSPTYFIEVYVGATLIISNAAVTKIGQNIYSWNDNNTTAGTRTVKVRAQEFGDFVDSNEVTDTYTRTASNFRYYRLYGSSTGPFTYTVSPSRIAVLNLRFYTSAGQLGTVYPTTNLTTNTSETGIVASYGHFNSATYDAFRAFDSSTSTFYWSLGVSSGANNWLGLEFQSGTYPTPPSINSIRMLLSTNGASSYVFLYGSNTGAFAGEQTFITSQSSLVFTNTTFNIG